MPPSLLYILVTSSFNPSLIDTESYITCRHGLLLSHDRNDTAVSCTTRAVAHSHELAWAPVSNQICCSNPQTEIALRVKVTLTGWKALTYHQCTTDLDYNCITVSHFE